MPYKNSEKNNLHSKSVRLKLKQEGLCNRCWRLKERQDRSRCNTCLRKGADEVTATRHKFINRGICVSCHTKVADWGVYCQECRDRINTRIRVTGWGRRYKAKDARKVKDEVFHAYGGYKCACPGCNVTEILFLTIDHVNNDGSQHRKQLAGDKWKSMTGIWFYRWLKRNNFPPGYQVLCMNCNFGKRMNNGVCPLHGKSHMGVAIV